MPKSDSAATLLKRLEKIERAQGRLGSITTRILAQAETLADLLKVAQGFAADGTPAKAAGRAPAAGRPRTAKKASTAKRPARKAAAPRTAAAKRAPSPKAGATKAAPAPARRRAPRRPASA